MKATQCSQCHSAPAKYKCPIDHFDYCSLACFKLHKASSCNSDALSIPLPPPPTSAASPSAPVAPANPDARPTKRLKKLHWPPEPSSSFWDDPLQRDDVKPLRGVEYEALATTPTLRPLLASSAFQTVANALLALPNRKAKERALRVLLGLPADAPPTVYRPGEGNAVGNTRGGGRGRGGRGRGGGRAGGRGGEEGVWATDEERGAFGRVVKEVMDVVEKARVERGER